MSEPERSEKTGRYVREQVRWEIPPGTPEGYEPGSGYGEVKHPNDGGFVWIVCEGSAPIVPHEFVFPFPAPSVPVPSVLDQEQK